MTKSPWYRWPENKNTGLVPWWTILRRLSCWPLLLIGKSITFVAVLIGFGMYEAISSWKEV